MQINMQIKQCHQLIIQKTHKSVYNYISGMDRGIFPHLRVNMNPVIVMKRNWQKMIILADPGQSLLTKTYRHI